MSLTLSVLYLNIDDINNFFWYESCLNISVEIKAQAASIISDVKLCRPQ